MAGTNAEAGRPLRARPGGVRPELAGRGRGQVAAKKAICAAALTMAKPARGVHAFLGMSTADIARSFRADVAFLSTSAVDNGPCCHQVEENVRVKRALTAAARRKVLLVDHSAFGRQALYELAPLADFDLAISDEELPQEERDALESLGMRYELAAEGAHRR
ncbi:hypothetical protein AB0D04_30860 [Streptomyces sp. NPDC048483]|uniref:hypothetical protein n=1 Tax=Streptomyces sp. NPDC048483 TaxID=3154927 RepID=UPI00343E9FCC